ncbi:MAG: bifunctional UDP-N-acetylmuramoyl-tripeptide:D-alanyl-D-alanine ligase/alanine racemase [Bacteroidota bacterium]|nr:bifunctional UDP-N-acetylmuramoyl-tripeptide:D-alanyl-D-alanine ligase/alanine racemase [Bacteroidota bacterium]
MKITFEYLAKKINGILTNEDYSQVEIKNILFDSRRLNAIEGTVFFAITTNKNTGNKYISDLYAKGIKLFVVDKTYSLEENNLLDACFLQCNDVLQTLQTLATIKRELFHIPICAITGSNGKTITKDWILSLIGKDKKVCANTKSYNSQIGVALSVFSLEKGAELGIFEAGISQKNEMQTLEQMIKPNIGIFTNIGDAHQINFSSMEEKIQEKLKLFVHCKQIIFHNNNPLLTTQINIFAQQHNIELISWGREKEDTYQTDDLLKELNLPFLDKASVENTLNAYVFCLVMGVDKLHLQKRIQYLQPIDSRLEILQGISNSTLINDAYSNDYTSLEIALDCLNSLNNKEKLLILSDMQQTSLNKVLLYRNINTLLKNKNIERAIFIGSDFCEYKDSISLPQTTFYHTTQEFLFNSKRQDYKDKTILIKGARDFHFEDIVRHLSLLGHQSFLEVNLSALDDNVNYFRSFLQKDTMLCAMVKASAYGTGAKQVAWFLENNSRVNYLAVAFADEGVELRQNGITLPVMVMTPEEDAKEKILEFNLEPVVHSFEVLERFYNTSINIHIKLDTGMHRLGFEKKDIPTLIRLLSIHKEIKVKSIFSHLYGADNESLDKYTLQQISLFDRLSKSFVSAFDYKIMRHLCNSAAIIRFPSAHFDMVRLGIGMYGIGYNSNIQHHLRNVVSLYSCITQIRNIDKNEDVSYSRKFVSPRPMRIGVIPIGYADGLNRHLGNENFLVYINKQYCPIIGNICMDMCMIDLTSVEAKVGDRVEVFSENNFVGNMAKVLDTIPYEIFTSISQRIKRVYFRE